MVQSDSCSTEEKKVLPRPVLKWAGGKAALLPQLLPEFPIGFKNYFEPFLGGGAVFFALASLRNQVSGSQSFGLAYLNDVNPELINVYAVIRDFPYELMSELHAIAARYSEQFYYELRSQVPAFRSVYGQEDKELFGEFRRGLIKCAARTIFLNKTGFNGLYRQNSRGVFNVPFGKRSKCPSLFEEENLMAVSAKLSRARLSSVDFEEIIEKAQEGDFVYCDPPYEPLSPSSSFNAYHQTGFSQTEQERLKEACMRAASRGARVVISNSSAPFIKELYAGWTIKTISAKRMINSKGSGRGNIEELLITL